MTVPGFVRFGAVAVAFQLAVVGGVYGYLRYRHPVTDPDSRRRSVRMLLAGAVLAALGQLVALGAVGSLQVVSLLSLESAVAVQNVGLLVAAAGYVGVVAGIAVHTRATE